MAPPIPVLPNLIDIPNPPPYRYSNNDSDNNNHHPHSTCTHCPAYYHDDSDDEAVNHPPDLPPITRPALNAYQYHTFPPVCGSGSEGDAAPAAMMGVTRNSNPAEPLPPYDNPLSFYAADEKSTSPGAGSNHHEREGLLPSPPTNNSTGSNERRLCSCPTHHAPPRQSGSSTSLFRGRYNLFAPAPFDLGTMAELDAERAAGTTHHCPAHRHQLRWRQLRRRRRVVCGTVFVVTFLVLAAVVVSTGGWAGKGCGMVGWVKGVGGWGLPVSGVEAAGVPRVASPGYGVVDDAGPDGVDVQFVAAHSVGTLHPGPLNPVDTGIEDGVGSYQVGDGDGQLAAGGDWEAFRGDGQWSDGDGEFFGDKDEIDDWSGEIGEGDDRFSYDHGDFISDGEFFADEDGVGEGGELSDEDVQFLEWLKEVFAGDDELAERDGEFFHRIDELVEDDWLPGDDQAFRREDGHSIEDGEVETDPALDDWEQV
ncbi:hypothetical protein VTJ49DRAFT_7157 [Mycothermus thermophilus]|uniref:Uncharacterized protein n=1 Tax=Humicola insolens TaxID=85995 RepID=A0ABR3VHH0_HUMIN